MNQKKVHSLLFNKRRVLFACLIVLNDIFFYHGQISWWEGMEGVWKALTEKGGKRKCGTLEQVSWTNECPVCRQVIWVPLCSKHASDLGTWGRRLILISAFTSWLNLSSVLHFSSFSFHGFLSIPYIIKCLSTLESIGWSALKSGLPLLKSSTLFLLLSLTPPIITPNAPAW